LQFWIDILARGGVLQPGQLKAEDILYDPANFAVAAN
jgi:hypothetical protein